MSYDIEITSGEDVLYEGGMTFNVQPMFVQCFKTCEGINYLDGKDGLECYDLVMVALTDIQARYSEYAELNPENGWGSVNAVIHLLTKILGYFICDPTCIMKVMK